jgi:hypothetical protein
MAEQQNKQSNTQRDANLAAETRPVPSQAEGEEDTVESVDTRPIPSQAEGDEETVDEDLAQKGDQQSGSTTAGSRR